MLRNGRGLVLRKVYIRQWLTNGSPDELDFELELENEPTFKLFFDFGSTKVSELDEKNLSGSVVRVRVCDSLIGVEVVVFFL